MNTEALIDAVIERLQAAFVAPRIAVQKWPSDPKSKPQFTNGHAALWVGYSGSASGKPESIDFPVQERARIIAVALHVRSLHGVHGAASYVDAVNEVLHGWRPDDGRPLELDRDQFGAYDNGVWRYDLVYRAAAPAVPRIADAEPGPALARITFLDPVGGDSEVPAAEEP